MEGRLEVRRKTRREVERKRQEGWPKERCCVGWRGGGKDDRKEGGGKNSQRRCGRERVYQMGKGSKQAPRISCKRNAPGTQGQKQAQAKSAPQAPRGW